MIIDGKAIKQEIILDLQKEVSKLEIKPHFVVIQVGNDEGSNVYINQKIKMASEIGYICDHIKYDNSITEIELLKEIDKLNLDDSIHGIMVQMPLPNYLNKDVIQNRIKDVKDIDGLSDINAGKLFHNVDGLYSCTPLGIMELLRRYNVSVESKNVVVVGRSNLVGKPVSTILSNAGATVTLCHSKTIDLKSITSKADILVVAIGKAKFITEDMVKEGAVVIDVGITRTESGLCGDVDFENVSKKCELITPVPGGVGPMTVAMLGVNILKAYNMQVK